MSMSTQQRSLRARWWRLRWRVRRVPLRIRLGVIAGIVAVAGLCWQYSTHHGDADASERHQQRPAASATPAPAPAAPPPDYGDNPEVGQLPAPTVAPQLASIDAARALAARFATNFASPNDNHDDWLARISPDVSQQLIEQYRLTDIRNVPQAAVSSLDGPLDELPGAVAFRATYNDGTQIEIRLALAADGWKVANVVPVNSDTAPAPASPSPGVR
ncbi:hypothetical protein BRW65_26820 [Mycobacterium paraffinicum]|uniref:Uncharacterized protein n=2 Tax=Mycobacterium TaxID=1763 RepID=A0A1Q4HGZ0_9MYCO|nr:hypothetical protein [Mycobacterium paraffinicum]OJZ66755.1 hypothetical protein BRW65_26820 [Mycobacterium paraffinicum]